MLRRFYSARTGSTAILLDWTGSHIAPSWQNLLSAARKLSVDQEITAILPFHFAKPVNVEALKLPGISRLVLAPLQSPHRAAEELTSVTKSVLEQFKLQHLLAVHDSFGKNCMPRMAALVEGAVSISDVLSVERKDDSFNFSRSIYAGNAIAKLSSRFSSPHFLTIRSSSFEKADIEDKSTKVESFSPRASNTPCSSFIKQEITTSKRPELSSAKIVVSGGRALKSAQNFASLLEPLADTLNAAIGASRAAVDAGFVSNDLQVGQTGKIVAPQLYIAIGISGAIQHVAGMKASKVIVAINKDAECPIFQIADYGLVGDLFTLIPELTEKLKSK